MVNVKPYPKYLTPLALSFQTANKITRESVLDFYDVFVAKLLKEKVLSSDGVALTVIKNPKNSEEQQLLDYMRELQFILPVSLYEVKVDVSYFCTKVLEKVNELWPLTEKNKMVPALKVLVDNSLPVSFVEPKVEENIDSDYLRDLLTTLHREPVYHIYDSLEDKIFKQTGKKYEKDSEKNFTQNHFFQLKKYIDSTAMFSPEGINIAAPKFKWLILGFVLTSILGSIIAFNITSAFGMLVMLTTVGVLLVSVTFWLIMWGMSHIHIARLTPEGKLMQAQLYGWERFIENTPNQAEYELSRPAKVNKPWSPYRARRVR